MVVRMRQPYLRHDYRLADAGMHIEEINIKDPIMDFYVTLEATNGSTSNVENSMIDVLDSIQIVDGSDILWALDSEEILANQLYHYKESTSLGIDERPDKIQKTVFKIPLGIGRMHPDLAFDPTRFANPQMILNWDLENIRPVDVDAFVTNSLDITIMADVIDEAPSRPTGYLMTKELTEYETTIGDQRVELPVDYAYRTMYVRAHEPDKCPQAILNWVKHGLNEDKYRPFDIYVDDWLEWLKEWYGLWHQGYWYYFGIGEARTINPYLRGNLSCAAIAATAASDPILLNMANCEMAITSAGVAADEFHVKADGSLPFGTWAWPYGDAESPEEWLQLEYTDKSRLTVNALVADCRVQVFLTQHRKY